MEKGAKRPPSETAETGKNLEYECGSEFDWHVPHGSLVAGITCERLAQCSTCIAQVGHPDVGEDVDAGQCVRNLGKGGHNARTHIGIKGHGLSVEADRRSRIKEKLGVDPGLSGGEVVDSTQSDGDDRCSGLETIKSLCFCPPPNPKDSISIDAVRPKCGVIQWVAVTPPP